MPQKKPELDLDFNIYVDQSCLSEPMDEATPATLPLSAEAAQEPVVGLETCQEPAVEDAPRDDERSTQADASGAAEEAQEPPAPDAEFAPAVDETEDAAEATPAEDIATEDTPAADDTSIMEQSSEAELTLEAEDASATVPETEAASEQELEEEAIPEPDVTRDDLTTELEAEDASAKVEDILADEPAAETEDYEQLAQDEAVTQEIEDEVIPTVEESDNTPADIDPQEEASYEENHDIPAENADAPTPQDGDSDDEEERGRQQHTTVDRKTSLRTEALIQAAARAVVAKIERRKSEDPAEEDEHDTSLLSADSQDTYVLGGDDAPSTHSGHQSPSSRQSSGSQARHIPSRSTSSDDAGDSSSHHEADDDVFSDRSARSSVYSLDGHSPLDDELTKTPQGKESLSRRDSYASSSTTHLHPSPRAVSTFSNFSTISGLSQYDDKHHAFIPTTRDHRMPFRTPSEIRAMQMASPTPSVFNGSSPRSSASRNKRHSGSGFGGSSSGGLPPLSRVGSPTVSAQYSPKGRSTPPRFKGGAARKEEAAPLVLLHVTLLPLRWVWGEVLNGLDAVAAPGVGQDKTAAAAAAAAMAGEQQPLFEPSEQLKTLRDGWRELQDCVGDTVLERGILLPHPQNDYEVLEERLLEALELPVRRRARILECGHYLGPANDMMGDAGEVDAESDDEAERDDGRKHWCVTCREEIRYERLGPGKVFRVKVYASNGLMRAGAWEACWKEMERVDVEVEPIVESAVQGELEKLGALQLELEEQRRQELEAERTAELEAEMKREAAAEQELRAPSRQQTDPVPDADLAQMEAQIALLSSRPSSAMQLRLHASSPQPSASTTLVRAGTPTGYPLDSSDDRRRRDEERLREIYGDAPSPAPPAPAPAEQHYQPQAVTTAIPPPMPMLTDGSSLHHRHPHQDPYGNPPPQEEPYRAQPQNQRPASKIVLDENSGFVELLMEAFKVLLRDPKNVAIIVLCVFLVVLMRTPGMGFVQQQQQKGLEVVPAPAPAAVGPVYRYEGSQQEAMSDAQGQGQGGVPRMMVEGVKDAPAVVDVEEVVAKVLAGEELAAVAAEEVAATVDVEVSRAEAEATVEVEEVLVVEEPEQEVLAETAEAEALPVAEEVLEEITVEEALDLGYLVDTCPPRGLEYPMTMADEIPVLEAEEAEEAEHESSLASEILGDEIEQVVMEASASESEVPSIEDCTAPTAEEDADTSAETDANSCQTADDADCNSDSETDDLPAAAASASTLDFIPGPFVTERKTVRVFETVTETVRVSVVTQTETVSHVVTAVPQTLEETVYETETVKITVSVPVEERKKGGAKATKGCKDKGRGWF